MSDNLKKLTAQEAVSLEEEYFKQQDAERLSKLREKLDREKAQLELQKRKETHWMRCPKCGGHMSEFNFKVVVADKCDDCGYIGFDNGELELVAGSDKNVMKGIINFFKK
ncbi:MAG: zf-TFIIB domain-containing protein [Deltaproteobacteria bacterium]|nr:zf-TFIIB domain-containing protein [Deltaproteobacteria bacterium]